MAFEIATLAFVAGAIIPIDYTCDGADRSPALTWKGAPKETKSFVLIMDDPDAPMGVFVHWVMYDIPPTVTELPENMPKDEKLLNGAKQGITDFGRVGYGGPCPPRGVPHRYYIKLYALDAMLNLAPKANRAMVDKAMEGHILASCEYMGKYKR